jgi:hypothetical protein
LFAGLIANESVLDGAEWGSSGLIQGFNVYAVVEAQPISFSAELGMLYPVAAGAESIGSVLGGDAL